jgi:hypothetical protein
MNGENTKSVPSIEGPVCYLQVMAKMDFRIETCTMQPAISFHVFANWQQSSSPGGFDPSRIFGS